MVHLGFSVSSVLCAFSFWLSFLKLNIRKKGTLIINSLLGNLETAGALRDHRGVRVLRKKLWWPYLEVR